jgi:hypothetical protein
MMTDKESIIELIRVLGKGHKTLIFNFKIGDLYFHGIRLYGTGFEVFYGEEITDNMKAKLFGAEEIETVISDDFMTNSELEYLRLMLEDILMNY